MTTDTPDTGAPVSLVTFPVTVFCWAEARDVTRKRPINTMSSLFFIVTSTRELNA
jgi:hypothetical protein